MFGAKSKTLHRFDLDQGTSAIRVIHFSDDMNMCQKGRNLKGLRTLEILFYNRFSYFLCSNIEHEKVQVQEIGKCLPDMIIRRY